LHSTCTDEGVSYDLVRCKCCNVVVLWPPPSADELRRAYSDVYYGSDATKFSSPIEIMVDHFRRRRAKRLAKLLGRPGRALDIGCGNGKFLGFLQSEGFQIFGSELPGKAFERASKIPGIHLTQGELQASDYEEGMFDLVTMWHVFEHLDRPADTVRTISRIVSHGGLVSLSVPNFESLQRSIFRGNWFHLDPPRHLFFMGPEEIEKTFSDIGFRLVSVSHFSFEHNLFGVLQSLLNTFITKRDSLYDYLKFAGDQGRASENEGRFSFYAQMSIAAMALPAAAAFCTVEAAAGRGGTVEFVFEKTT